MRPSRQDCQSASTPSKAKSSSLRSPEIWDDPGKLGEMGADMRFECLLHRVSGDAELRRHQRRDAGRPVAPGIALLARKPEHQRRRAGPVDQFALHALEAKPGEMRLGDLMRRARLDEGDP